MPASTNVQISKMVDHFHRLQPTSVLDIGVGFGKWGFLLRECLEIGNQRYHRHDWQVKIDGIEIFPQYKSDLYDFLYDHVYFGDALEQIDHLPSYDLIIAGDVIEHFEKPAGLQFIEKCLAKAPYLLLSSPVGFQAQDDHFGNCHERHLSHWTAGDFSAYRYDYDEVYDMFVALITTKDNGKTLPPNWVSKLAYQTYVVKNLPNLAISRGIKKILCRFFG